MEPTREPVAVLGIGGMGHGMATSALRASIRTTFGTATRLRLEIWPSSALKSHRPPSTPPAEPGSSSPW